MPVVAMCSHQELILHASGQLMTQHKSLLYNQSVLSSISLDRERQRMIRYAALFSLEYAP